MKRKGFLYEDMCSPDTIRRAINSAARGKKHRCDVRRVLESLEKHVTAIKDMLENQSYKPAPYFTGERFDSHSKKTRLIRRPKFFPDQVMHWVMVLTLEPIFMRGMYYYNCGSIKGRGSSRGQKAVKRWLERDRKNTKYALKLDIRHFYESVPHEKLMNALKRKIKDERVLDLAARIIDTSPGIPIGNYTSQWFANFYLERLDHYIKENLKAAYYVRYIDDIVIFGRNKKKLHALRRMLFTFIGEVLSLVVKGNWQLFPVKARGVDFLGYVFFHGFALLRHRNFLAFARQCRRAIKIIDGGRRVSYHMAAGLVSRVAQLKHCSSQNIKHKYYDKINENYLKGVIKYEVKRKLRACAV